MAISSTRVAMNYLKRAAIRTDWADGDPSAPRTPWGPAQFATQIARGVRQVATASHGGIGVADTLARKFLSKAAYMSGIREGGYVWFEEDEDWAIPFYEVEAWRVLYQRNGHPLATRDYVDRIVQHNQGYMAKLKALGNARPGKPIAAGDTVTIIKPLRFRDGTTLNPGQMLLVDEVRRASILLKTTRGYRLIVPRGYEGEYFEVVEASAIKVATDKEAGRTKEFDIEKGDFGIMAASAYGYSNHMSIYWPLENIGRKGKTVNVREVRVDEGGSTAWAETFKRLVKNAPNAVAANKILDDLMEKIRLSPTLYKDSRGNPNIYDGTYTYKGVDQSLPTPKSHIVPIIHGRDITIDLNKKPIEFYSKSEGDDLDKGHMTYWFRVHPQWKAKLLALAPEFKDMVGFDPVMKLLRENGIKYDHHMYMDPMYD